MYTTRKVRVEARDDLLRFRPLSTSTPVIDITVRNTQNENKPLANQTTKHKKINIRSMLYLLCRKIPCRVAVTLNFGLIDSTNLFHLNCIRSMPKTTINRIAQTSRMNVAKPERTLSEHNRKTRCCLCLRSKSDWIGSASVYQRPPAIHKLDDVVLRHGKPAEEKTRKSSLSLSLI